MGTTYVDRVLYYDFFANNKKIHEESLNQAGQFISKVKAADHPEKHYQKLIEKKDLATNQATLSKQRGIEWDKNTPEADGQKPGPTIKKAKS